MTKTCCYGILSSLWIGDHDTNGTRGPTAHTKGCDIMKRIFALAGAAVLALSTVASAAVLEVTGIAGIFDNSTTTNGSAVTGEGTSAISWGDPATDNGQSGYSFAAVSVPFTPVSVPFTIGSFNHLNYPIFSPSLLSTELTVTMTGNVDGVAFSTFSTYGLSHTETTNSTPCFDGSVSVCDDIVTLTGAIAVGDAIVVGDTEFFLSLSGFQGGLNFFTQENAANSAPILATFTSQQIVPPVPVPASALLLGTALAGVGVWGRRRKRAA